jgi:hypothetical protein
LAAAAEFGRQFRRARLDTLRAADPGRPGLGLRRPYEPPVPGAAVAEARARVWAAITTAGGLASRGGRALWRVLGLGEEDGADVPALVAALDALTRSRWSNG